MILGLRHVGIVVSNLDSSMHFYGDLLGFRVEKRMEESGPHIDAMLGLQDVRVETVKMTMPFGRTIELLRFWNGFGRAPGGISEIGISHIALTVLGLDEEYARLVAAGVEFISAPQLSGQARVAFCMDPDGNAIELVEVLC